MEANKIIIEKLQVKGLCNESFIRFIKSCGWKQSDKVTIDSAAAMVNHWLKHKTGQRVDWIDFKQKELF